MGVNSLLKTVTRQRRDRFEPGPSVPESSTLTTRLASHPPLEVGPLNPARGYGECCKLPQRIRAERGRQMIFSAFGQKNASVESNFMGTFTKNMFAFSLFTSRCEASTVLIIYLLAFSPLLLKAVNWLPRIYNNKLKFPLLFGFFCLPLLYQWCIFHLA